MYMNLKFEVQYFNKNGDMWSRLIVPNEEVETIEHFERYQHVVKRDEYFTYFEVYGDIYDY